MTKQEKLAEKENARKHLLEWIKPGDTVYTILRHVSKSGMSRDISVLINGESSPHDITYQVGKFLGDRFSPNGGSLRVSGCGMDMGFAIVYNLAAMLYPEGFECTGREDYSKGCPSNDHSNGDRVYTPHRHASGGYALRHAWL